MTSVVDPKIIIILVMVLNSFYNHIHEKVYQSVHLFFEGIQSLVIEFLKAD